MKKILSVAAAIALAAALISCSDSGSDEFKGDTVLTLKAPSVKAKAYPGVNYISWEPVASADHYEVYRTQDGVNGGKGDLISATKNLSKADIADADFILADGVTYKYTVIAVPATVTGRVSREVVQVANQSSVTVKAIVPALGTDLANFSTIKVNTYKDYLAKFAKISDPVIVGGNFSSQFKATAGLKYAIQFLKADWITNKLSFSNAVEAEAAGQNITWTENYKENFIGNLKGMAKESGKFTAYLTIASVSPLYTTSVVKELGSIEVKDIGEKENNATSAVAAAWAGPTSISVTWTPAKLAKNGDYTPVANYKVFRSSSADNHNTLTAITAAVTKVEKLNSTTEAPNDTSNTGATTDTHKVTAVQYRVVDSTIKAEENSYIYRYYVVHTDGTYYGTYKKANNEAEVGTGYTATPTLAPTLKFVKDIKKDAKAKGNNTIKLEASKNTGAPAQTLKLEYLKLDEVDSQVVDVFASTFTILPLSTEIGTASYAGDTGVSTAYLEDAAVGTYLFKLTASETGKSDKSVYLVGKVDALGAPATTNLTVEKITSDGSATAIKGILVQDSYTGAEKVSDYTYTLYSVTTTTKNKQFTDYVEIKTAKVDALELKEAKAGEDLVTKYGATAGKYAAVKTSLADGYKAETAADGSITEVRYYVAKTYAGATAAATKAPYNSNAF